MGADAEKEPEHTLATVVSSTRIPRQTTPATPFPRAATPTSSPPPSERSRSGAGSQTTVASPMEALERDEILRTRWFCFIALAIAIAGGGSVALLPGDPTASLLVMIGAATAVVAIVFLYRRTRDPIAFRKPFTMLGWFVPAACVTMAIPFFGPFSPVGVVLVLGVYFTGVGRSWPLALAVYIVCAGMQGLIGGYVIAGGHDTGIIRAGGLSTMEQAIVQALVQFVLLGTLITARISRRSSLVAIGELERAVRIAAQREALLLEAREELERALRAGRGRFTEQQIGPYLLGSVLGRGAMGEVYEAQGPNGTVAIKLLSHASLGNPNHVMRFFRELRTAAGISSPHVVQVIEVGEQPVPFLVMERLEGHTLAEILRTRRALPVPDALEMVRHVGAGITAAAAAGIIHRDLKPQNVFLHHGTWKILDFGIARGMDQGDTLTAGHVVGTPSYMAPEQATGGEITHASDLYALAAIAYRVITGQPPYAAGEVAETLYRVVHTRPRRPSDIAIELDEAVDLVLAIGLAKDPARRFRTAADFATALADAFTGRLPDPITRRGRDLEAAGAWAVPKRAATARLRVPRT